MHLRKYMSEQQDMNDSDPKVPFQENRASRPAENRHGSIVFRSRRSMETAVLSDLELKCMIFSKAQVKILKTNTRNYYVTLVNIFVMAILSLFFRKNL